MIPIGKKGIIKAGRQHIGWDIFVQDDTEGGTGRYYVLYSKGKDGFDAWVEDIERFEKLFDYEGFEVEWEN